MKKFFSDYWSVLLDALVDTLKILPILFIAYYIIELIEFKYAQKLQNNRFLKGKASPLVGALLGSIPQCGFSVVLTDLYSRGAIAVGCLVSVYIATSDEAIPILMAYPNKILSILLLVAIKIVWAIIVGYIAAGLFKLMFNRHALSACCTNEAEIDDLHQHEHSEDEHEESEQVIKEHNHHQTDDRCLTIHDGCCHHHVETKQFDWLHPVMHCLKISLFILAVNFLFGCVTTLWVGEGRLTSFLTANKYLQPLLAVAIGLIPNCASSVVLTQLFVQGGLRFGALLAGLCMNAGLGLIFLMRLNKKVKENVFIFLVIILSSLAIGYGLIWLII